MQIPTAAYTAAVSGGDLLLQEVTSIPAAIAETQQCGLENTYMSRAPGSVQKSGHLGCKFALCKVES